MTVFLVAHQSVSYGIAISTIIFLLVGYGATRTSVFGAWAIYIETICLSLTSFLLMAPTASETLRRVPDGHPFVTDLKSPFLLGAQASLLVILLVGLSAQILALRKKRESANTMRA